MKIVFKLLNFVSYSENTVWRKPRGGKMELRDQAADFLAACEGPWLFFKPAFVLFS